LLVVSQHYIQSLLRIRANFLEESPHTIITTTMSNKGENGVFAI
jgi:hypothetical protein